MMNTQKIIEQVESLPLEGRAQVVDALLRTLNHPDPEVDEAWVKEAQRRLDGLRSGQVKGIPADEVFTKARARFSK